MKSFAISKRRVIQAILAVGIYMLSTYFGVGLGYIVIAGSVLGIIFGKVFCRWMCPIGFIMELMTGGGNGSEATRMYQYHKMGCPIAWISGFLNRASFINIKIDKSTCTSCGLCDKTCYISSLNDEYSLYKDNLKNSGEAFSCSRCLECITACPNGSLKYTALPINKKIDNSSEIGSK